LFFSFFIKHQIPLGELRMIKQAEASWFRIASVSAHSRTPAVSAARFAAVNVKMFGALKQQ
jgi:hypothetical protein